MSAAGPRVSNLSHVELLTQDVGASYDFFTELLGLEESARDGDSVYLRAWGEWGHHSLVLTESPTSGVAHIAYRVDEEESVPGFRDRLRSAGVAVEDVPAGTEPGQGDAIRFALPSGHTFELFHGFERAVAEIPSVLKNQPAARRGRGIEVPRIDHVNIMAPDVGEVRGWVEDNLGLWTREVSTNAAGAEVAAWMTSGPLSHDFAASTDPSGSGRLHHLAYAADTVLDYWRFGELAFERGIAFEGGPGRHGGTGGSFVYVREPGGGNRIELYVQGQLIFDPDPPCIRWTTEDEFRGVCVGQPLSKEFYATGTPEMEG